MSVKIKNSMGTGTSTCTISPWHTK